MAKEKVVVYVVDDDESVRKGLMKLLRTANLDGEAFPSAEDFLKHASQNRNACILIDIRMPGLTGFDLQKRLLSQGMEIPVIVVSASDDYKTREEARKLGAIGFFRKPVDDQALLDAIWWAISEAPKN